MKLVVLEQAVHFMTLLLLLFIMVQGELSKIIFEISSFFHSKFSINLYMAPNLIVQFFHRTGSGHYTAFAVNDGKIFSNIINYFNINLPLLELLFNSFVFFLSF